eukprot:1136630-Pelagomonas_calceolata.AAC.7
MVAPCNLLECAVKKHATFLENVIIEKHAFSRPAYIKSLNLGLRGHNPKAQWSPLTSKFRQIEQSCLLKKQAGCLEAPFASAASVGRCSYVTLSYPTTTISEAGQAMA